MDVRKRTDWAGLAAIVVTFLAIPTLQQAVSQGPRVEDYTRRRYEAIVVSVHDGDTFRCVPKEERSIRIAGIDAPEIADNEHGKADPVPAAESKAALEALLRSGRVFVEEDADSFGRHVGPVRVLTPGGEWIDVGARMIETGKAIPYQK